MKYHVYVHFQCDPVKGYLHCLSYSNVNARTRAGAIAKVMGFNEVKKTGEAYDLECVEVQEVKE